MHSPKSKQTNERPRRVTRKPPLTAGNPPQKVGGQVAVEEEAARKLISELGPAAESEYIDLLPVCSRRPLKPFKGAKNERVVDPESVTRRAPRLPPSFEAKIRSQKLEERRTEDEEAADSDSEDYPTPLSNSQVSRAPPSSAASDHSQEVEEHDTENGTAAGPESEDHCDAYNSHTPGNLPLAPESEDEVQGTAENGATHNEQRPKEISRRSSDDLASDVGELGDRLRETSLGLDQESPPSGKTLPSFISRGIEDKEREGYPQNPPKCFVCGARGALHITGPSNPNKNAGRPYYLRDERHCWKEGHTGGGSRFMVFRDEIGNLPCNRECLCGYSSKLSLTNKTDASGKSRRLFYTCRLGECNFYEGATDDDGEDIWIPDEDVEFYKRHRLF